MFFDDMPESIPVPPEFQHKQVELILLTEEGNRIQLEWEPDFFDKTYGSVSDMKRGEQEPLVESETW
jgi:hypothetical protein